MSGGSTSFGVLCASTLLIAACSGGGSGTVEKPTESPVPTLEPAPTPHGTLFLPDADGPKIAGNRYITACGALPPEVANSVLKSKRSAEYLSETQYASGDYVPDNDRADAFPMSCRYELGDIDVKVDMHVYANVEDATQASPQEFTATDRAGSSGRTSGRVGNYDFVISYQLPPLGKVSAEVNKRWSTALGQQLVERVSDPKRVPSGDYFPSAWGFDPCRAAGVEWFEKLLSADPGLKGQAQQASQEFIRRSVALGETSPAGSCERSGNMIGADHGQGSVDVEFGSGDVEHEYEDMKSDTTASCSPIEGLGAEAVQCAANGGTVDMTIITHDEEYAVKVTYSRSWDHETTLKPTVVTPSVESLLSGLS